MTPPTATGRQAGFSIIEVLIASVVLLFIALGLIPLFTMAIQSNLQGQDSTSVANFARAKFEEFWQLPWEDPDLQINAGTERVFCETYDSGTDQWIDQSADCTVLDNPPPLTTYVRTTTIEEFNIDQYRQDVEDGVEPTPLAVGSGTPAHFKRITVEVESVRPGGILGGGKALTVQAMKSV